MKKSIYLFGLILTLAYFSKIYSQCVTGDCKNGEGTYLYSNAKYWGNWKDGKLDGKGVMYFNDGSSMYQGNYSNGKKNGFGILYWSDGNRYEGNWIDDNRTGQGTFYWKNGDRFVGQFLNGQTTENGVTTIKAIKKGCVSGDCYNSYGKWNLENAVYEGYCKNGKKEGKGKMIFWDNAIYEGDYTNDLRNGKGKYTYCNGSVYDGDWVNGERTGKGIFIWGKGKGEGDVYEGSWIDNQATGYGKSTLANGTIEEGLFENGKFLGTVTQKQINSTVQNNTKLLDDVITEAPKQNCTYKFIKPTNLTYNYIDNRKDCCYCRSRYATYSLVSNTVNSEQAIYLAEKLYSHFQSVGADEDHKAHDFSRYKDFMKVTYPGFENLFLGMMAELSIPMFLFYDMAGKTLGSTVREINKYKVESNFCSPKCKDDCSYSSSCKCD